VEGNSPADVKRDTGATRSETASDADAGRTNGEAALEQLRQELDSANDRALRAQAELENYRRRARRELEDERRWAALPLIRDLLPVLDNVGRAIDAAQKAPESETLLEGFKMVSQQLDRLLEAHQCRRIEALHRPFDPHLHQAISQQPSDEYPASTVVAVVQNGFQLHDRVIRPSQVIVATAPPSERDAPKT